MNERNKKVYAIIIAVLLVLSVSTSFLPSIQVIASAEPISFQITSLDFISSGRFTGIDSGFNYSLYDTGYNDAISGNRFPLDALENVVSAERNPFPRDYDGVYTRLISSFENYNYSVGFNDYGSGSTYNDLKDFITDPSTFNYQVIVGNSSTSNYPVISIYYSRGDLKLCQVNSTVYAFSTDIIYNMNVPFNQNMSADYRDIRTYSANILNNVQNTFYNVYSTFPVFLTYQDNSVSGDNDYSSYSSASTLATDYLVNGVNSEFFIDRRLLFSNFIPDIPNYNVNTDPLSQENVGVYDFDFYPSGGVTSGIYVIDNLQLSAKTSEMDDVNLYALLSYNFTCSNGYYSTVTAVPIVENYILQNMNTKISQYGIISSNNLETSIPLDDTSYQTFSARSILRDSGPVDDGKRSYYVEDHVRRSISMLHLYGISDALQLVSPSQTSPKTIVQSTGAITNFSVACSIKIDYGNGQTASTLGTIVYDYFTGQSTKSGLTSTDNNTPLEDISPTIQGQLNDINSGGFNGGVGGNTVNGGNNSNVNNPSFVNNNNPSITINNNNGLTEPDGIPDNPSESSFSMLWSIWESYHFAEWLNQDLEGNGFLHYIFSSQIWDLPIFNLIIPALAILITVSIASTIIRFIRGN